MEDMDLSLRTYLAGWKAVFLKDVTCLNEVSLLCQADSLPMSATASARTAALGCHACALSPDLLRNGAVQHNDVLPVAAAR